MLTRYFVLVCTLFLLTAAELKAEIKAVDGDSLLLNGKRIRLIGIDAPELFQPCFDANGKSYDCGKKAQEFLKSAISNAREKKQKIFCRRKGKDVYKRDLSVCYAGNVNLNLEMVKNGWATSYRSEIYTKAEQKAREKQIGIWQGRFMRPEIFRAIKRANEKSQTR